MFCNQCGNNIADGLANCPVCGAPAVSQAAVQEPVNPVNGQNYNQSYNQPYGQQYNQPYGQPYSPYGMPGFAGNSSLINDFLSQAKTLRTYGIVATVLMFGIGFIFSIVILVKAGKLKEPTLYNPTPAETEELEKAKKVLKTAKILAFVPFIALALSFVYGFVMGLTGTM